MPIAQSLIRHTLPIRLSRQSPSGVPRPTTRAGAAATGLVLSSMCAACGLAGANAYVGTGSLATSGGPTSPLLASHVVVLADCASAAIHDGVAASFSILALGEGCVMDGHAESPAFVPDPGTVCALRFADGVHALRVTDVAVRFGLGSFAGRATLDSNSVQVELGGDDATTGTHALYRFSGANVDDSSARVSCEDERLKHIARVPSALQQRVESPDPFGGPASEASHRE